MKLVKHPNVVTLVDCFYSKINTDIYLNLVMEFIPETLYFTIRQHGKAGQTIPFLLTKLYCYQLCRAISYCHQRKICHRDIKPQNLLVDPLSHTVKLCDFGSAKKLNPGEPNVSYICSRYYRAPELIFESQFYETTIDLWSLGCVFSELFLGTPLFQGEKSVDQLVEIIKVLGTPTQEDIKAMNPDYQQTKFPVVKPLPWRVVFATVSYENQPVPNEALDLLSKFLIFSPKRRLDSFEALVHPYFDELRNSETRLLDGSKLPPLFNFTEDELQYAESKNIKNKIIPEWYVDGNVNSSQNNDINGNNVDNEEDNGLGREEEKGNENGDYNDQPNDANGYDPDDNNANNTTNNNNTGRNYNNHNNNHHNHNMNYDEDENNDNNYHFNDNNNNDND